MLQTAQVSAVAWIPLTDTEARGAGFLTVHGVPTLTLELLVMGS